MITLDDLPKKSWTHFSPATLIPKNPFVFL